MAKLSCEQASLEVRADLVKALLVSLIDRRVDAVREVCESILNSYSEQEKHFLSYHAKLQEDHARAQTPFDRSMLAVNLLGATEALEGIREDKHRVFQAMVQAIVAIGGDVSGLQSFSRPVLEF